jgi:hypothetical protein
MIFIKDDGGRYAAGFKGSAGDCVTRAVAIASGRPYKEIYIALSHGMGNQRKSKGRTARNGISTRRKWFKDYMRSIGFAWHPTMGIGTGCKVHLTDGELPMGRLVVAVSGHYTAVIDGVIHDTYSPERDVAEFRQFPGWQTAPLKPEEQRNQNGIFTRRRRCVYGYWQTQTDTVSGQAPTHPEEKRD